jgi:adenosylhomocysteine nucleosidase
MIASNKVAIVAALEREVRPLIKRWHASEREHGGTKFKFFENDRAVLVCGGIGPEAARRACEAVIAIYRPSLVTSAGFAGALEPGLAVGSIQTPRWVIDASDGSRTDTGTGAGALVSAYSVAGPEQKAKFAKAYGAQAVDMESAAVARGAQARGIRFTAIKAISDESDLVMLPVERFVDPEGHFQTGKFLAFAAIRPWLWPRMVRLAKNASRASRALCGWLEQYNRPAGEGDLRSLESAASRER